MIKVHSVVHSMPSTAPSSCGAVERAVPILADAGRLSLLYTRLQRSVPCTRVEA